MLKSAIANMTQMEVLSILLGIFALCLILMLVFGVFDKYITKKPKKERRQYNKERHPGRRTTDFIPEGDTQCAENVITPVEFPKKEHHLIIEDDATGRNWCPNGGLLGNQK